MFLSDRDLWDAIRLGYLRFVPAPRVEEIDACSIDLHLDHIETAKIWDADAFQKQQAIAGHDLPTLRIGTFSYNAFAEQFHRPIPHDETKLIFCQGQRIILRPGGFFLWQTREEVGTPEEEARYICFVNGKSSIARTGLLVHMTAPTIHAGWWGKITLEISNLGPFNLSFKEGDAIAQIVVATLSSFPLAHKKAKGIKVGQANVSGTSTHRDGSKE